MIKYFTTDVTKGGDVGGRKSELLTCELKTKSTNPTENARCDSPANKAHRELNEIFLTFS